MIKNYRRIITKDNIKDYLKHYIIHTTQDNFNNTMNFKGYSKKIFLTLDELIEALPLLFNDRYNNAAIKRALRYYNVYQYTIDNLLRYNKIFIIQEYIKINKDLVAPRITLYYKKT